MEIENNKLFIKNSNVNLDNLVDMKNITFKNQDYILKHNMNSNLKFFKDELTIKYIGKGNNTIDYASVQSTKPINKINPIFYFEVEISDEGSKKDITIGLSDKEFVMNKQCGTTSKSYGFNSDGKIYHEKPKGEAFFVQKFKSKDVIGCGYYFSKNSIFYTINGRFINWAFNNVDYNNYFPTVSLHSLNEKITFNFGRQKFLFDIEGFYMLETEHKVEDILKEEIKLSDMDYIIREYLVHSGYQETFMALEDENTTITHKEMVDIEMEDQLKKELSNISWRKDSFDGIRQGMSENFITFNNIPMEISEENFLNLEKMRKYSIDENGLNEPQLRKRTLSIVMDRINHLDDNHLNESGAKSKTHDIFIIMNFLKERKIIQNMIKEKDYDMALSYFENNFISFKSFKEFNFKKIVICLVCLKYLQKLSHNDYIEAYQILNNLGAEYWTKEITISLYDNQDKINDYSLENLSVLLCYENILQSELNYFFTDKQIMLISDQINSLILELSGLSNESILEKVIKQQTLSGYIYRSIKNCPSEKITIKL